MTDKAPVNTCFAAFQYPLGSPAYGLRDPATCLAALPTVSAAHVCTSPRRCCAHRANSPEVYTSDPPSSAQPLRPLGSQLLQPHVAFYSASAANPVLALQTLLPALAASPTAGVPATRTSVETALLASNLARDCITSLQLWMPSPRELCWPTGTSALLCSPFLNLSHMLVCSPHSEADGTLPRTLHFHHHQATRMLTARFVKPFEQSLAAVTMPEACLLALSSRILESVLQHLRSAVPTR
jgi:hypothetical protein